MSCALFAAYPELAATLPHRPLGTFPTPIERAPGLLPGGVDLWIKREDRAGRLHGGNKVRKLEFLLADPRIERDQRPGRRLLTFGAWGSHQAFVLALHAREMGLSVDAVLYPQPDTAEVRRNLLATEEVARVWLATGPLDLPLRAAKALCAGPWPSLIVAPGGSSPLGTLGWVSGGLEIAAQVKKGEAPRFDVVYAPLGSSGTVAGLWLGLGDAATRLVGVRVVPFILGNKTLILALASATSRLIRRHLGSARLPRPRPHLCVDGRFFGGRYGEATPASEEALSRGEALGLSMETTYTGKTLAAILGDARAGLLSGRRVLFVHTYGGACWAKSHGSSPGSR